VNGISSNPLSEAERIIQLEKELAWAHLKIQVLEERLRLQRIQKVRSRQREAQRCAAQPAGTRTWSEQRRSPGGKRSRAAAGIDEPEAPSASGTAGVARRVAARGARDLACVPEQCTCKAVCQPTAVIGYDVSEHLDLEPAKYFVVVTKRKSGPASIARKAAWLRPRFRHGSSKRLVADGMVIHTVVAKYSDHLPLYRQSAILEREAGVEISRATMDGWVMRWASY